MSLKSIKSASFHDRERLLAVHSQDNLGWQTLGTILPTYMQTREMWERQESCSLNASRSTRARPQRDLPLLGVPRMQSRGVRMMRMRRSGRRNNSACCRHTSPRIQIPAAKYLREDFAGWSTPNTNSKQRFQRDVLSDTNAQQSEKIQVCRGM